MLQNSKSQDVVFGIIHIEQMIKAQENQECIAHDWNTFLHQAKQDGYLFPPSILDQNHDLS